MSYQIYKAKLKNELTPNRKKNSFLTIALYFFFLLSFWACVLDHFVIAEKLCFRVSYFFSLALIYILTLYVFLFENNVPKYKLNELNCVIIYIYIYIYILLFYLLR